MAGRLDTRALVTMSDDELVQRCIELAYRRLECAIDPDHPASRANGARWAHELRLVEAACERRGLFAEATS